LRQLQKNVASAHQKDIFSTCLTNCDGSDGEIASGQPTENRVSQILPLLPFLFRYRTMTLHLNGRCPRSSDGAIFLRILFDRDRCL